jgi:5'(3')-deoxyribonucleotidase
MYTVAMDVDGVLYPFEGVFSRLYKQYGGEEDLVFDRWVDFSTLDEDIVSRVWKDPLLFNSAEPIPGAVETMKALSEMPGVKVVITTSFGRSPEIAVAAKWSWIQRWFPWVEGWDFITIHHKWLLATDMLVDDFHHNVEAWMKHNKPGCGVLVKRPWNKAKVPYLSARGALIAENGVQDILPWVQEKL